MTVSIDLTTLTPAQLSRLTTVALLVRSREHGNLAARIAGSMVAAVDAERMRRIARAEPRMQQAAIDTDQDAAPDAVDAEIRNALATLAAVRDSDGTDPSARPLWNDVLIALAELRDQRAASKHVVIDLLYPSRTVSDDAA